MFAIISIDFLSFEQTYDSTEWVTVRITLDLSIFPSDHCSEYISLVSTEFIPFFISHWRPFQDPFLGTKWFPFCYSINSTICFSVFQTHWNSIDLSNCVTFDVSNGVSY
jgi:hypothetical protein